MKELKNFSGIKLFPDEEILNVQRQHWIVVFFPLVLIFAAIVFVTLAVGTNFVYQYIRQELELSIVILLYLAIVSFLLSLASYLFFHWYYQVYIITNKRLAHIHFFRMAGFHLDEVFHEHIAPLEIDRHPQNFLLNLLDIEDIYVHFRKLEKPEPFIFSIPQDEEVIEEILEHYFMHKK